jgi:O-antigen/teichoic acid export membrane protein
LRALRALLNSPSLRAASFLILGGAGFAAANILLARELPAEEFGQVSLALALMQIGLTLGPLGLEVTINRRGLGASKALLAWSLVAGSIIGAALAAAAAQFYVLTAGLAFWLGVSAAASGVNRVGGAFLQARQQLGASLLLGQVHNYLLLCAVPVVILLDSRDATLVIAFVATGYVFTSVVGWSIAWPAGGPAADPELGLLLRESLAGLGIVLAMQVLWQIERLVIPRTLSMTDLGAYALVAATAGSPFRMVQIGIGHTLPPRLRACRNLPEIKSLLLREGKVVGLAVAASVVLVPWLTLWIAQGFLDGRYEVTGVLLVAVVATGLIKVWQSIASAVVQSLAPTGSLIALTVCSWTGVLAGVGCAVYGAQFGLAGVVFGAGVAWFVAGIAASVLAVRTLRRWPGSIAGIERGTR